VISRANAKAIKEMKAMGGKRVPTFEEVWAGTGLVEKYRAQGEAEGKAEVAKSLISRGQSLEDVAEITKLDLKTVKSLAEGL
jgi:hypothetical protein